MEAKMVKRNAGRYTLIDGNLFRHGYTHPILTCVSGDQCVYIMAELHEGICGSHIGGWTLSLKVIWAGYYWPTMKEDCVKYAQRCEKCQKHADWHHAPAEELQSIYSPWPFHTWEIDILGPFPLAIRQMNWILHQVDWSRVSYTNNCSQGTTFRTEEHCVPFWDSEALSARQWNPIF